MGIAATGVGLLSFLATGFRPANQSAQGVVAGFDQSFTVKSQIEYYRAVIIDPNGTVSIRRVFIIYDYAEESVDGIFRLLPDHGDEGFILLSKQERNKKPHFAFRKGGDKQAETLTYRHIRRPLRPLGFHIEDILDDDKEEWEHQFIDAATVDGRESRIIENRHSDEEMQRYSPYGKRHTYFAKADSRFLKVDFFDKRGRIMKTTRATAHSNVGTIEHPQVRARILQTFDHRSNITVIMVKLQARYDLTLPEEMFEPSHIVSWGESHDNRIFEWLKEDE